MEQIQAPVTSQRSLILCFDGTGNKFQGTAADSNIVKIFSLLDRQDANQFHYYQPGIGTYVETSSLSHKSRLGKVKSAYAKAKDMAVGTSFGEHVMAGYKFLMRYHKPGDNIYLFGFFRGAYTARSLAQMLDYVGLLSAGNEEMLRFAWKTFARWQMRTEGTKEEKLAKRGHFDFMRKFRETFSIAIERIRFIGLFDCVNSVPQFESAWMSLTKFPYTANTSARVIRHAVAIDERRAKFRQDLVSEQKTSDNGSHHLLRSHLTWHHHEASTKEQTDRPLLDRPDSQHQVIYRPRVHRQRLRTVTARHIPDDAASSLESRGSFDSATAAHDRRVESHLVSGKPNDVSEDGAQDILEVWFAGQHGDVGGGWTLGADEERPASDLPLMWMLREARKAGMPFDEDKLRASGLIFDEGQQEVQTPAIRLDGQALPRSNSSTTNAPLPCNEGDLQRLETAAKLHDSLAFGGGMSALGVSSWQIMEYLPFRRMDLQPDGSWKPINWPLPRGEVRDMPPNALIHMSVIHRMQADPMYRPGNVILGGGGRGIRKAPEEAGIGDWRVAVDTDRLNRAVMRAREGDVSLDK
ncbi:hypothetical protein LTR17_026966 [Elasticomyces elasticus]|nr:hypothetical protein LTR17_026966 [Elasticomyces elasticus]